ncbi:MAG: hypothetical protein MJ097_00685 [Dorea sp.]|nr:hypothetical protein [Dorea sp.]
MAEYSLITPLDVPVGGTVPYNNTICNGCCNIRHRNGSGIVKLKGGTCCRPNRYHVQFHAAVTGVTGAIQMGLYLDGEPLPETLMAIVSGADANLYSLDAATEVNIDGCWSTISARVIEAGSTAGEPLTINTANIIIHKEAS